MSSTDRPMPDFFVGVRPILLREDGSPRMWVRNSWAIFLFGAVVWPPCVLLQGYRAEGGRHDTQMSMIRLAVMGIPFSAGIVYASFLADVIRPETGRLAKLGVGVKPVAEHKIRALRRWRLLMLIPAASVFSLGCYFLSYYVEIAMGVAEDIPCSCERVACWQESRMDPGNSQRDCDMCCFANEQYPRQLDTYFFPPAPACLVSMLVGYPTAMAWYFSMKVKTPLPFPCSQFFGVATLTAD